MDLTSGDGQVGQIELSCVSRFHDGSVGIADGDWNDGRALIDYWRVDGTEVRCTAGVGDDGGQTMGRIVLGGVWCGRTYIWWGIGKRL